MKKIKYNFKSRKAEGMFGMSFGMIFSIILIVFFFAAAFMGIKAFLNFQKCAEIGMFLDQLQTDIDYAWNSNSALISSNATLPGVVKYICFVNLSSPVSNANNIETSIYDEMRKGYLDYSMNTFVYAPNYDSCVTWKKIKHLELSTRNPRCIPVINGRISVKIERNFEDKYPRIIN